MCVYFNVAIGLRPCTFTLNMKHTVEDMPRLHKLFHRDKHRTGYSLQTWSWWFFIYIYFAHIDLFWYNFVLSIHIFALPCETDLKPSMYSLRLNLSVSVRKSINEIISALHFFIFFCCLLFHLMFFLYIL